MKFTTFVSNNIFDFKSKDNKSIKIVLSFSFWSIVIGIFCINASISISSGFQKEIQKKIDGFGTHLQIVPFGNSPTTKDSYCTFSSKELENIQALENVKDVYFFIAKPSILVHEKNIKKAIIKGVSSSFFQNSLSGFLLNTEKSKRQVNNTDIIISDSYAQRLNVHIDDTISVYIFRQDREPKVKKLHIKNIYKTGLNIWDDEIVFVHLNLLQNVFKPGIKSFVKTDVIDDSIYIEVMGIPHDNTTAYRWGTEDTYSYIKHKYVPFKDTSFQVSVTRKVSSFIDSIWCIEDTSYINITEKNIHISSTNGSHKYYYSGMDILLRDFSQLEHSQASIYDIISTEKSIYNIKERANNLFSWLDIIYGNVTIILSFMFLVCIINIASCLCIFIFKKTHTIGILRCMGVGVWQLRKIFMYPFLPFLTKAFMLGNIISLMVLHLEKYMQWISLNEDNYFVEFIPIHFNYIHIIIVNVCLFVVCFVSVIIFSGLIIKIAPNKSIRFH